LALSASNMSPRIGTKRSEHRIGVQLEAAQVKHCSGATCETWRLRRRPHVELCHTRSIDRIK
jgi:hypothetical protein